MSHLKAKIAISLILVLITSIQVPWQATAASNPVLTTPVLVDFSDQTWAAGSSGINGYSVQADVVTTLLVSIQI